MLSARVRNSFAASATMERRPLAPAGSPARRGIPQHQPTLHSPSQSHQSSPSNPSLPSLHQAAHPNMQQPAQQTLPPPSSPIMQPMLSVDHLSDLLASIAGPNECLDPALIPLFSRIADEFVEEVGKAAASLAALRSVASASSTATSQPQQVEGRDVRFVLEEHWGMHVAGLGAAAGAEERAERAKRVALRTQRGTGTEAYRTRAAAAKRAATPHITR